MVQYDSQTINQYLARQLQGDELEQFELQLLTDESLQRDVDEHRSIKNALHLSELDGPAPSGWRPPENTYALEFLRSENAARLEVEAHKSALISIDLGPDEFVSGHMTLRDKQGVALVDQNSVSDEEGLMDVLIPGLEPGEYRAEVTGPIQRTVLVIAS